MAEPPLSTHGKGLKPLLAVLVLLCGGCSLVPGTDRNGFEVIEARLSHTGKLCLVDANLDHHFSSAVIEALEQGVPLTLVRHFKLSRIRYFWLDEPLVSVSRSLHLSVHPKTRIYRIVYSDTGVVENFSSLTTLIEYLGSIRDWPITTPDHWHPDQTYQASLRITLDIEALPLPLRPIAYLSPDWHLESPRYLWRVAG
ncbi:MAG: DUF4390 domain-containing protein [Methylococcaceae bacterium]